MKSKTNKFKRSIVLKSCSLVMGGLLMGGIAFGDDHIDSQSVKDQFPGFQIDSATTQKQYAPADIQGRKHIPEGHVGYVTTQPSMLGFCYIAKGGFLECKQGPYSYGFTAMNMSIIPIDVTPNNFREGFMLQTDDRLSVAFQANATLQVAPKAGESITEAVKDLIQNHGGQAWYEKAVKAKFRSIVRDAVLEVSGELKAERLANAEKQKSSKKNQNPPVGNGGEIANDDTMNGLEINGQKNRDKIERLVTEKLKEYLKESGKPIKVDTISIANLQFPQAIQDSVNLTIQRKQELQRKPIEQEIANENAKTANIIAEGEAKAINTRANAVRDSVTPLTIQADTIRSWTQVMLAWAQSPNKAMYVMPTGQNGTPVSTTNPVDESFKVEVTPAMRKQLEALQKSTANGTVEGKVPTAATSTSGMP